MGNTRQAAASNNKNMSFKYQCRHLRWAGEQKNMSLHTMGPNVKRKTGNEQKNMVGNAENKHGRGMPRVFFFPYR